MDAKISSAIGKYIAMVAKQNPDLAAAYLFGSYAKNNEHQESDIDIALVINNLNDSDKFDIQVQLMLLASKFDSRIEPHPLSKQDLLLNNPLIAEIKRTGIEIKIK